MRRAAFTLVEVLVSILIFSVVSVAMLTVFTLSTRVFRETESARMAGDEAIGALAALDEDLRALVPAANGGFLYAGVIGDDGNTALGFLRATTGASHQVVLWYADPDGRLYRATTAKPTTLTETLFLDLYQGTSGSRIRIAAGCLLFAADLATDAVPRTWSATSAWADAGLYPLAATDYTTVALGTLAASPFPTAVRVSLVMTGTQGDAPAGFVVRDDGQTISTRGLPTLPVVPGAMVRLGPPTGTTAPVEWVAYGGFQRGRLLEVVRAQRRTATAAHVRDTQVRVGRTWTIVRELPR